MCFWTDGLRKTWLHKRLKSPVSENPWTSNMVNGPTHYWNLNDRTFTIFIDHRDGNSVGKSLCGWYPKCSDCLLRHWLPMTSIVYLIETNYCCIFRWNYLRKKKLFPNFFLHFRNLNSILIIWKKKMTLINDVVLNCRTLKNVVR